MCPMRDATALLHLRLERDLVRAPPEDLAKPSHLKHLRHAPPALPEIDRLRTNPNGQRQLKLGPAAFETQLANGLHAALQRIDSLSITDVILQRD